jgi:hypothetical protein
MQGQKGDTMRVRALFIAAALATTVTVSALAPQVASAAHKSSQSTTTWVCHYEGGQQEGDAQTIAAPGIGKTFKTGTGFGSGNGPEYGGITTGLEQSLTSLTLVSVTHLTPGWTAVVNQAGPPKVVVQFTNTGGGGLPPNTYRLRSFFTIRPYQGTSIYVITLNTATCVPAS